MKPGLPFDTLLEVATGERDACAKRLAEASQAAARAADRLRLLETHRAQVTTSHPAGRMEDGAQLRDKRAFIARLDVAISKQSDDARICEEKLAAARRLLQDAEVRLRAFGNLKVRADRAQATVDKRREQHQMDEYAARRARASR